MCWMTSSAKPCTVLMSQEPMNSTEAETKACRLSRSWRLIQERLLAEINDLQNAARGSLEQDSTSGSDSESKSEGSS